MIPSPLDAVIFDKDGLLLDTETVVREAMFRSCEDLGYEMTDQLHLSVIGSARESTDARLTSHFGPEFPLSEFRERCRIHFEDACRSGVPVKAGARELLEFLKECRIPVAVATSTRRERSVENLKRSGLNDFVDVLITRDDVRFPKPHPESFLKAAARLRVEPPQCLALEDSYNGIRAAHAAGMATIMIPDLLEPVPDICALCVAVMDSLEQVKQALEFSLIPGKA